MVGDSQGVRKGLIYSGFNILFIFFAHAKGFRATSPIGIVEPTLDASMHFFLV
jgi:hypothetical protein